MGLCLGYITALEREIVFKIMIFPDCRGFSNIQADDLPLVNLWFAIKMLWVGRYSMQIGISMLAGLALLG